MEIQLCIENLQVRKAREIQLCIENLQVRKGASGRYSGPLLLDRQRAPAVFPDQDPGEEYSGGALGSGVERIEYRPLAPFLTCKLH
jgi:hypothetical protein